MPTIKGFTTEGDVLKQLRDAGAVITLPFIVDSPILVDQNPFAGFPVNNILDADGEPVTIEITP